MMRSLLFNASLFTPLLFLTGCQDKYFYRHGCVIQDSQVDQCHLGMQASTIHQNLGEPTFIVPSEMQHAPRQPELWVYYESLHEKRIFLKDKRKKSRILILEFDHNNRLQSKKIMDGLHQIRVHKGISRTPEAKNKPLRDFFRAIAINNQNREKE